MVHQTNHICGEGKKTNVFEAAKSVLYKHCVCKCMITVHSKADLPPNLRKEIKNAVPTIMADSLPLIF
jgi:hypothetical protein